MAAAGAVQGDRHRALVSLQQRLVKTGVWLIEHTRYYWLLLAESHFTRRLFGTMLGKIAALLSLAGVARLRDRTMLNFCSD